MGAVGLIAAVEGERLGSMVVFFLIALVLVSPFGFAHVRRTLRLRRVALGLEPAVNDGSSPGSEPLPPDPDDLASFVAAIEEIAAAARADGAPSYLTVPEHATVEGRPAPRSVVDALLNDAARRTGLRLVWEPDQPDGSRRARLYAFLTVVAHGAEEW